MKKSQFILLLTLVLMPTTVFALSTNGFEIFEALLMEGFVSIHMSVFVLLPLSRIISENNSKKVFWILFFGRVAILLFFDLFITTDIAMVDFIAVFIGAFTILPISIIKQRKNKTVLISSHTFQPTPVTTSATNGLILTCSKCGANLNVTDKFCSNCGEAFDGNNVVVNMDPNQPPVKKRVLASSFAPIYSMPEDKMVESFIRKELIRAGITENTKLLPRDLLKRKQILNIIFSFLIFIYISLIFFHFPIYTYLIGLIILIIFYVQTRKFSLMKYLVKQLKERPSEKISNIVMSVKESFQIDNTKTILITGIICATVLPLAIFYKPRILYEKMDNGYGVRFYTFGVTNFTSATIPETYKGEKVVSLRGNTFSNMPFLNKVILPNSIVEIRGQAFKNDRSLKEITLPSNLEYLGGGAFYNCTSLKSIVIPDSVTFLGGEAFYNATSLKSVKLSNKLTEIRGNTFENCSSLVSIDIPDTVTRIGGHAFYGNSSLSEVNISPNSSLKEIGSSAFRRCYSLDEITIPSGTYVNERAFKESPTIIIYSGDDPSNDNNPDSNY